MSDFTSEEKQTAIQELANVGLFVRPYEDRRILEIKESEEKASEETLIPIDVGYPRECFEDTISEDLICGICHEVARNPFNLPCAHILCKTCLQQSANMLSRSRYICPICRTSYATESSNPFIDNTVGSLKASTFAIKIISALSMKCPYFSMGCEWKGTIGLGEQCLNKHLRNECRWGGYEKCQFCATKILILELSTHYDTCPDIETKCKYCDWKGIRRQLKVHQLIGEYTGNYCASSDRCPMKNCSVPIKRDQVNYHLRNECDHHYRICYGCPESHYLPAKHLQSHIDEKKSESGWSDRWLSIINNNTVNVGDLRYIGSEEYTPEQTSTICRIEKSMSVSARSLVSMIPCETRRTAITYTCPPIVNMMTRHSISSQALNHLSHHECSITSTGRGYTEQPFFQCKTCSNQYNTGVCAVCASECHWGHDLELCEHTTSSFCDCGAGDIKPKGIGHCRAPKALSLPVPDQPENDVVVLFLLRGNLEIEVKIGPLVGDHRNQSEESKDDDDSDDGSEDEDDNSEDERPHESTQLIYEVGSAPIPGWDDLITQEPPGPRSLRVE